MIEIRVPQLGVNDQSAKIVEWLIPDGDSVKQGQALCVIETTKVAIEIPAERDGIVKQLQGAGEDVGIGQIIGLLGISLEELNTAESQYRKISVDKIEILATDKAKELAKSLGIDLLELNAVGIIREKDVLDYHNKIAKLSTEEIQFFDLIIYGAGAGGLNVRETVQSNSSWSVAFVDDVVRESKEGIPAYSSSRLSDLKEAGGQNMFLAIANGRKRIELAGALREAGGG